MRSVHCACVIGLAFGLVIGLSACGKRSEILPQAEDPERDEPAVMQNPQAPSAEEEIGLHVKNSANPEFFAEPLLLRLTDPTQPGITATEAISWLAAGLRANPDSASLKLRLRDYLTGGVWHIPVLRLPHPQSVDLVDAAGSDTLWVAMGGDTHTVVRWDLSARNLTAIWAPISRARTEFWKRDSAGRRLVLGRAGVRVLGDAITLKPICVLSGAVGGEALTAFSADGLLLAYPADVDSKNPSTPLGLRWLIRDALSGMVLREIMPGLPAERRCLAARIDRKSLEVRLDDGSTWILPISPVESPTLLPPGESEVGNWLAAWFPGSGPLAANGWCGLYSRGEHQAAEWLEAMAGRTSPWVPDTRQLLAESPWSRRECLWNGPPQGNGPLTLAVRGSFAWPGANVAPFQADAPITALTALNPGGWVTACDDGTVLVHQILPAIGKPASMMLNHHDLCNMADAMDSLVIWLGGGRPDPKTGEIRFASTEQRANADWPRHMATLERVFPGTDFTLWAKAHATMAHLQLSKDALSPLQLRLARMQSPKDSSELDALVTLFQQKNDDAAVLHAIQASGGRGAAAAMALKQALASDRPDWIRACLAEAVALPPTLSRLADSRASWLEGQQAAAFESWPDPLPDLASARIQEDWDGWEQVDYSPEYEEFRRVYERECATLCLPPNTDLAGWQQLVERLADPATARSFGKKKVIQACLTVATSAPQGASVDSALRLVSTAEGLGAERASCLRAAALALTATGNYREARDRWIELISLEPVRCHQPGDYAEAAYTAFENSDSRQAMAILATGMHRFSDDARFALRAGWVALLTGNPHPAYRFLLAGHRSGFPQEIRENAIALLAVAAFQAGAPDDATAFFQDLIALSPDWNQPTTIESLSWPDELKSALKSAAGW